MTELKDLPKELQKQVYDLAKGGRIFMATHYIRKATKLGSKPAKALVMEILQAGIQEDDTPPAPAQKAGPWSSAATETSNSQLRYDRRFAAVDKETQHLILQSVASGNKITAIKALRAATGLDLTEAVQIINDISSNSD